MRESCRSATMSLNGPTKITRLLPLKQVPILNKLDARDVTLFPSWWVIYSERKHPAHVVVRAVVVVMKHEIYRYTS